MPRLFNSRLTALRTNWLADSPSISAAWLIASIISGVVMKARMTVSRPFRI
jgi:hypothetical protein